MLRQRSEMKTGSQGRLPVCLSLRNAVAASAARCQRYAPQKRCDNRYITRAPGGVVSPSVSTIPSYACPGRKARPLREKVWAGWRRPLFSGRRTAGRISRTGPGPRAAPGLRAALRRGRAAVEHADLPRQFLDFGRDCPGGDPICLPDEEASQGNRRRGPLRFHKHPFPSPISTRR